MKQSVVDIKRFIACPSRSTIRKHKRIVGLSAVELAEKATKRGEKRRLLKEKKSEEYKREVMKWEEFLGTSSVVDQQARNPAACYHSFGSAPSRLASVTADSRLQTEHGCFTNSTSSTTDGLSDDTDEELSGCKFSP
jgi:hypothetical protein